MRLLLTRAAEDAARTREALIAMGHQVVLSPVIEMVGTGKSWPGGVVDALLATSAQAFRMPFDGPSPEMMRVLPLFLVGSRTEAAAREAGFLGAATTGANAASLAACMSGLAPRPRRTVYLAGRQRKPEIETALAESGYALEVVEVYEARALDTMSPDATKAFGHNAVDGALHFSRRSAALFIAAAQKAGLDISRSMHFCLSEDVAAPIRDAGCGKISVAAAPREPDLLALVGTG